MRSLSTPARMHRCTLGYVLLGIGALMLASMLHISGPVMAIAIIGAGYYLLKASLT